MRPIAVPAQAQRFHPGHRVVDMGRPAGVPESECGSAEMLLGSHPVMTGFSGRDQFAYFKPSEAELKLLNEGGYLELNQIGTVVQPFSLQVWAADTPTETTDAHAG